MPKVSKKAYKKAYVKLASELVESPLTRAEKRELKAEANDGWRDYGAAERREQLDGLLSLEEIADGRGHRQMEMAGENVVRNVLYEFNDAGERADSAFFDILEAHDRTVVVDTERNLTATKADAQAVAAMWLAKENPKAKRFDPDKRKKSDVEAVMEDMSENFETWGATFALAASLMDVHAKALKREWDDLRPSERKEAASYYWTGELSESTHRKLYGTSSWDELYAAGASGGRGGGQAGQGGGDLDGVAQDTFDIVGESILYSGFLSGMSYYDALDGTYF